MTWLMIHATYWTILFYITLIALPACVTWLIYEMRRP